MLSRIFCNERNMILLILLNAVVITLTYFPTFNKNPLLESLDRVITLLFVVEALVKIRAWGARYYFSRGWNRFDFLLMLLGIPSLLAAFLPLPDMSFWLILRLFRLVRLLRLVSFVPHIEQILAGLGRAMKASLLVLGILALMNYMLAMITCHFFGQVAPELFGNPFRAMYSMFQVFTIEGWNEIPATVVSSIQQSDADNVELSPDFLVAGVQTFFATVFLFGGVLGLSLANAVFVDEMTFDNTDELSEKIDDLREKINELNTAIKGLAERNKQQ